MVGGFIYIEYMDSYAKYAGRRGTGLYQPLDLESRAQIRWGVIPKWYAITTVDQKSSGRN